MRTEKEVKDRLDYLKDIMETAMRRYYGGEIEEEAFALIYSHIWDEMKHLYWVLGFESVKATRNIAEFMLNLSNTVSTDMKS